MNKETMVQEISWYQMGQAVEEVDWSQVEWLLEPFSESGLTVSRGWREMCVGLNANS
jgi:hypothetical protein